MKCKEAAAIMGTGLALAGAGVLGVAYDSYGDPGSYRQQIRQALGAAGLQARDLTVDVSDGTFSFLTGRGHNEQLCTDGFGSPDGVHVEVDSVLACVPADGWMET